MRCTLKKRRQQEEIEYEKPYQHPLLTQLALLVAVLLVMNYTPLGYLQVGPLSMSLLTIPVAIGAMTLGPVAGAILGGVFGTTSFVSALRTPSVMSAAMLQASPVGTFITCFVARVLVGLCAGWVYIGIKKLLPKNTKLCCAVGAVATPLLNTFWFMLSLCVFFFNTEYVQSLCATFGTTNRSCSSAPLSACRRWSKPLAAALWQPLSPFRC